jgi:hypothetical protein
MRTKSSRIISFKMNCMFQLYFQYIHISLFCMLFMILLRTENCEKVHQDGCYFAAGTLCSIVTTLYEKINIMGLVDYES